MNRLLFLPLISLLCVITLGKPLNAQTLSCTGESFANANYAIDEKSATLIDDFLKKNMPAIFARFPTLDQSSGLRQQAIRYFDDAEQSLLQSKRELSHAVEHQLPLYREDREQVWYGDYRHAEQPTITPFTVRHYNNRLSPYDKHPLIGIVRRKDRARLLELLNLTPEQLLDLSPKLVVEHQNTMFLMLNIGQTVARIVLDHFHIENFGLPVDGRQLVFEILPGAHSRLNEQEIASLNTIMCTLHGNITQSLGISSPSVRPNYLFYEKLSSQKLPIRPFILRHPLLFSIIQAAALSFIGLLLIMLIGGRYTKGNHTVTKIRKNRKSLV